MILLIFIVLFYYFGDFILKGMIDRFPFGDIGYQFKNVKKSAAKSCIVMVIITLITFGYIFIYNRFIYKEPAGIRLIIQISYDILISITVIFACLHEKERLHSIGLTKLNFGKSCCLGILLGIIFFVLYQILNKSDRNYFTITSLISFLTFVFVGFGEEIVFRGYFQTRLIAWLGTTKGWWITAIIFSYYHIPVDIFFKGMNLQTAVLSCTFLIPLSLLFGQMMIKTKSITSAAVLHTIIDWTIN